MKYVIINTIDAPKRRLVCEMVGGKYYYMARAFDANLKHFDAMEAAHYPPTPMQFFGFSVIEREFQTDFVRVEPINTSRAQYSDGQQRTWQDRDFGWEIGNRFSLPRVIGLKS